MAPFLFQKRNVKQLQKTHYYCERDFTVRFIFKQTTNVLQFPFAQRILFLRNFLLIYRLTTCNDEFVFHLKMQVMRHVPGSEYGLGSGSPLCCASNTHGSGECPPLDFRLKSENKKYIYKVIETEQCPTRGRYCIS